MPKTIVNCPNCRKPIQAEIHQLFDSGVDPTAKQILLSGAYNMVQCPMCGFRGNFPTPVVYHDPEKELLLSFVPHEVGLPQNEQERLIGQLITQVMNNLPQEKRKAYLFRPQSTLTMQGLVERVLEADGITREMLQAQQQKINILQRLLTVTTADVRIEIIKQEDKLIDGELFALLERLAEAAGSGGDQEAATRLGNLQKELLTYSSFGKQVTNQMKEVEAAMQSLQEVGKDLTREKLLEIVIKAPNKTRIKALVSLVRPGMDYVFFQQLSEKIDRARNDGRTRLIELRETLLDLTKEYDQQLESRLQAVRSSLEQILNEEDTEQALGKYYPVVDEFFIQVVSMVLEEAEKTNDQSKLPKLKRIVEIIQKASGPPPEMYLIEELLQAVDDEARTKILIEKKEQLTSEFMNTLTSVLLQVQDSEDKDLALKIKSLHRLVVRHSMQLNL